LDECYRSKQVIKGVSENSPPTIIPEDDKRETLEKKDVTSTKKRSGFRNR